MIRFQRFISGAAVAALAGAAGLQAQTAVEDLRITSGKSIVIDYPTDIARVSTANPEVADAIPVTSRELLLNAKGLGATTLVVWGKNGQRTFYNLSVEPNLEPLRKLLRETFPKEDVQIQSGRDSLSLIGKVSSQAVADRIVALTTQFGKSVVNNLQVAPAPVDRQILLRVKFAQIDRLATESLGFNLVNTGAGNTVGRITTGNFQPPNPTGALSRTAVQSFSITDALNIFAFRRDLNIGAFIQALQAQSLLQILAEPNLVTSNGKEASFLVGGEFPVPILQGSGAAGAVTIQFREYGIRLTFNPSITENGTIRMYVKPEVSTLDFAASVTIAGFSIPGLSTRRVESTVELAEGQSFIIGGLVNEQARVAFSRIPGLANIPVLGSLFKTKDENKTRTELIVMVTPEITTPLSPNDPKPLPYFPRPFLQPLTPPATGGTTGTNGVTKTSKTKDSSDKDDKKAAKVAKSR